jgi:hypothetical protein
VNENNNLIDEKFASITESDSTYHPNIPQVSLDIPTLVAEHR